MRATPQTAPTATSHSGQHSHTTLAWVIAVSAAAGAVIHIEAAFDHRDLVFVATGFLVMAIGQASVAIGVVIRPILPVIAAAGALHSAIFLTWVVSRTMGLAPIPGSEPVASVGVADVVANTFSIAVVAIAIVAITLHMTSETLTFPRMAARTLRAVSVVAAMILTVAALSAAHEHVDDDAGGSVPVPSHEHEHAP
jgi:hypothetical protein